MVRPPKILAFVFSVLAVLFILSLVFPEDGIRIGQSITLQFLTLDELFGPESVHYADISAILDGSQAISDSAYLAMLETMPDEASLPDTLRADEESLKMLVHPIEYPGGDSTMLYPFFRRMRRLKGTGNRLRIMHYGDSQIEGDRMTSFIRYKLQDQFGGSGIGLQPAVQLYGYQMSLRHTASDGWTRYTAFGNTDSTLNHNRFGVLGSFARFSPYPDSLQTDTVASKAWITLEQSRRTYRLTRMFRDCRIYYGNATQPVYFEVYSDGELYDADYLEVSDGLQAKSWRFDETPEELTFTFQSTCSPDFYGIALDGEGGLSVDNVSLRGSAGLVFSKMDEDLLRQMYDSLNVRLLLLQFGGNVVPYISDNYSYYEQWFCRELTHLKSLVPGLSIIVIGVADMSIREKDKFVTYPNLENVRDALRNAAFSADCAFWDMYSAMGGRNSMPSWVYAQPPLATSDFVHFNERGARVLAEMFYNAFMHDYRSYVNTLN
jgi:lysophospholipase L1-like esterase